MRTNFIRRNRRSERLPLEGKLAQRQLRLMRSKLSIFTMGWYDAVTFDLIRHAKRRDTFSSGEGFPLYRPYGPKSIQNAVLRQIPWIFLANPAGFGYTFLIDFLYRYTQLTDRTS